MRGVDKILSRLFVVMAVVKLLFHGNAVVAAPAPGSLAPELRAAALESSQRAVLMNQVNVPVISAVKDVSVPVSGTVKIVDTQKQPVGVSPTILIERRENQTATQRQAAAGALAREIEELNKQLAQRLAIVPRNADLQLEIEALNTAITTKRQALEFQRGLGTTLSKAAAESFVHRSNPYFLICQEQLWAPKDPNMWIDVIAPVRKQVVAVGRSVGLITRNGNQIGTAFVVGSNHVATNFHVLRDIADRDETSKIWIMRSGIEITFDLEHPFGKKDNCETARAPKRYFVNAVFAVPNCGAEDPQCEKNDVAVLLTSADKEFPPKVNLQVRPPEKYQGNMSVGVIGYPGPPNDMTVIEQREFFRTPSTLTAQFPFKRISSGDTSSTIPASVDGYFIHKANTSPGNSGSPIVDLADGALVGMHRAGHDRSGNNLFFNEAITSLKIRQLLEKVGLADSFRPTLVGEASNMTNDHSR